jgi:ribosomal protein L44E
MNHHQEPFGSFGSESVTSRTLEEIQEEYERITKRYYELAKMACHRCDKIKKETDLVYNNQPGWEFWRKECKDCIRRSQQFKSFR